MCGSNTKTPLIKGKYIFLGGYYRIFNVTWNLHLEIFIFYILFHSKFSMTFPKFFSDKWHLNKNLWVYSYKTSKAYSFLICYILKFIVRRTKFTSSYITLISCLRTWEPLSIDPSAQGITVLSVRRICSSGNFSFKLQGAISITFKGLGFNLENSQNSWEIWGVNVVLSLFLWRDTSVSAVKNTYYKAWNSKELVIHDTQIVKYKKNRSQNCFLC